MTLRKFEPCQEQYLSKNSKVMPSNHYLTAVEILVPYTTPVRNFNHFTKYRVRTKIK